MRTTLRLLVLFLVLLGLPVGPPCSHADDKPATPLTGAELVAALNEAKALHAKVLALEKRSRDAEAVPLARKVLAIRVRALGPEHRDVAENHRTLAIVLSGAGQPDEAEAQYRRALQIREKTLGPDHPYVADDLNGIALLLMTRGNAKAARPLLERALRVFEKAHGPDHVELVPALLNLATALARLGHHDDAMAHFQRALGTQEAKLGPDHPALAHTLVNLSGLLRTLARYDEALAAAQRGTAIYEKALGTEHPAVAFALSYVGAILHTAGREAEARKAYERALRIQTKVRGPNHPEVASACNNLAEVLRATGDYEQALGLFERALVIQERVWGPKHPATVTCMSNMALLLQATGQYERARPLLERAARAVEERYGEKHTEVAKSLNNLAVLYRRLGQFAQARRCYERALGIDEGALGQEHPRVARTLDNLAALLQTLGEHAEAGPLLERALAIHEAAHGPEHPRVAGSLHNLASHLRATGRYEDALPHARRALRIREKAFGASHRTVAVSLGTLGLLLQAMGRTLEGRRYLERAVKVDEQVLGSEHEGLARSIGVLAASHVATGEHEHAAQLYLQALRIVEGVLRRNLHGLQPSARTAMVHMLRLRLDKWLGLASALDRTGYEEVLRLKGLVARMTTAERRLARSATGVGAGRTAALRAAERRVARLANAVPPFHEKSKRAAWQEKYARAAAEREALALALTRDVAGYREGLERLDVGLDSIRRHVPEDGALLDFLRTGDRYFAWVVKREGMPARLDLGPAEAIEAAAATFAEQAADPAAKGWSAAAAALRGLLFVPLAKHVSANVRTLYVCPDAALAAVPFAALSWTRAGGVLADTHRIQVVSMAQDLVPVGDAALAAEGALLVGGVDYGAAAEPEPTTDAGVRPPTDRAPRGRRFIFLPGTQAEVEALHGLLGGDSLVLSGRAATEARLRSAASGKRLLHLATHGFVRDDLMRGLSRRAVQTEWLGTDAERQLVAGHDPMNLAGLAMAGASKHEGGGEDDGILTALEASHLDLDGVELVVLSACETALGKADAGEGVIGLVRGFQMAGARRVIGSLWRVDDEASRALMTRFYELWAQPEAGKQLGMAAALKQAQAFVRSQAKWKHPYYWAAWILWGLPD